MTVLWVGVLMAFLVFVISYKFDKMHIRNGFLCNFFIVLFGMALSVQMLQTENQWLTIPVVLVGLFAIFMFIFGIYILIAFLFLNARLVFKRENRSKGNSLTLALGIFLLLFLLASSIVQRAQLPEVILWIWSGVLFVLIYQIVHVFNFITANIVCNLAKPPLHQQYIIVLGSGLIQGNVPPLLAARIDKALWFYRRQAAVTTPPKIVFSGGKGDDEPRSEAVAMREYALIKGIPEKDTLVEDVSKTTYQNMLFSKKIMEKDADGKTYRCIYATSRYHVLRAGVYARKAGLKANGIGGKTAAYYVPNAFIREYIAMQVMYRKKYIILNSLIFLGGVGTMGLTTILTWFGVQVG